jgi:hypothetical protein
VYRSADVTLRDARAYVDVQRVCNEWAERKRRNTGLQDARAARHHKLNPLMTRRIYVRETRPRERCAPQCTCTGTRVLSENTYLCLCYTGCTNEYDGPSNDRNTFVRISPYRCTCLIFARDTSETVSARVSQHIVDGSPPLNVWYRRTDVVMNIFTAPRSFRLLLIWSFSLETTAERFTDHLGLDDFRYDNVGPIRWWYWVSGKRFSRAFADAVIRYRVTK